MLNETEEEVECGCDHLTHFAILLVSDILEGGYTQAATLLVELSVLHI